MNKKLLTRISSIIFLFHAFIVYPAHKKDVWLTVFVHGIMSIKPHISTANFLRFMKDKIENTIYSKTVEFMRLEKYFYLNQAMQGVGLQPLDINDIQQNGAPNAIARIYDEMTRLASNPTGCNLYYTFGWSGLLSPSRRYKDAQELFLSLEIEVQRLIKEGFTPRIRLIGYSHGGNICLNLAAVRRDLYPLSPLTIDELILIGVPIQTETDYLVTDQIFKKIYHFYSPHDRIQQIDLFSFNRFFSRKSFVNRKTFKMPNKLMQIRLKFVRTIHSNRKNASNYTNLTMDFSKPANVSGSSRLLRNVSPGHIELWFFGWSPQHYRRDFIFAPLPALVAIPHILHAIHQVEDTLTNPYTVIADVRPDHEVVLIKQYKPHKVAHVLPFATQDQIQKMSEIATIAKPESYNDLDYNNYIKTSFEKAMCHFVTNPLIKSLKDHESIQVRRRMRMHRKKICK